MPCLPKTIRNRILAGFNDLSAANANLTVLGDDAGDLAGFSVAAGNFNMTGGKDFTLGSPGADKILAGGGIVNGNGETTVVLGCELKADAGPDAVICQGQSTAIGGSPTAINGTPPFTYLWSPNVGFLTSNTISNPTVSPPSTTTYTVMVTDAHGCRAEDKVTVTVLPSPTTANAGPDQTVCGTSTTLAGNTPTVGTGMWSVVIGVGGSFANPTNPTTTFTGNAGTIYTLRWTISSGNCPPSSDEVMITLVNNPTTANAGPDQTVCGTSTTLAGNTPTVGTGMWSIVSGVGGSLANPANPMTTFTGTAETCYILRWTISNPPCPASTDEVMICFVNDPTPANAGPDQNVCGTSTSLAGNTPILGTGMWSIVSGVGGILANPVNPTTTFTGTAGTCYILRWTISNPPCPASTDEVMICFINNPTTANAGPDQNVCGNSTTLAGNVPTVGTGMWSIVSGVGGILANPADPMTTFTGTAGTCYILRWTISNPPCPASTDEVMICFVNNPTPANAGPDQNVCGNSTTLAGNVPTVGTGIWSIVSGVGGSFANSANPMTTFTGAAGTCYILRWTISNPPCPASIDEVTICLINSPTTANAGPDQTLCNISSTILAGNTPTVGTGMWSVVSGTGGSFANAANPTTTFTGTIGTTYILRWTISNPPCPASTDEVTIKFSPNPTADFTFTPPKPCVGDKIQFTDGSSSPGGLIASWSWSFGDAGTGGFHGGSSTLQNPTYTYAAAGTYTVTLTVTDVNGCKATTMKNITVLPADHVPPFCGFSIDANNNILILITDQDDAGTGGGIAEINILSNINGMPPVFDRPFTPCVTKYIKLTIQPVNPSIPANFMLEVKDCCGNITVCDPVFLTVKGGSSRHEFKVSNMDKYLYINNDGLTKIDISINNRPLELIADPLRRYLNGHRQYMPLHGDIGVDVSSYMTKAENDVVLQIIGPVDASAKIIFADVEFPITSSAILPQKFTLLQNYPNPFNPSTRIEYTVPVTFADGVKVELVIYNILGQPVKILENGIKTPNLYIVNWNGTDEFGRVVPTGIYLYRIKVGNFTAIKRMTLMK